MEPFVNLRAAFGVMAADQGYNDPLKIEAIWRKRAAPILRNCFPAVDVMRAEILLRGLRQPNDERDTDSPLWHICCGAPDDWPEFVKQAVHVHEPLHAILDEMFHTL